MTNRRITPVRTFAKTGLHALALVALARSIGPRRFGRIAALATEGYLSNARRSRRRRSASTPR